MFNAINRFSIVAFQLICSMNVLLTNRELQIVTDAEVLITKNKIIKKVVQLFAGLSAQYAHQAQASGYETQWSAKISRGENYCGLPYVILDYPREFSKPIHGPSELFFGGETSLVLPCNYMAVTYSITQLPCKRRCLR